MDGPPVWSCLSPVRCNPGATAFRPEGRGEPTATRGKELTDFATLPQNDPPQLREGDSPYCVQMQDSVAI